MEANSRLELESHNFNDVTAEFTLSVTDSFIPENTKELGVQIKNGKLTFLTQPAPEGTTTVLRINISELASLLFTAVDLVSLYNTGAVRLEPYTPAQLHSIAAAFRGPAPMTLSRF